jgi:hypothetical protein
MKIFEIGFHPLLKDRFPADVTFLDTSFRWADVRTYTAAKQSLFRKLFLLASRFATAWRIAARQDFDAVVARCLGPENSTGPVNRLGRIGMGLLLKALTRYASRGPRVRLAIIDMTDHRSVHRRDAGLLKRCDLYFKRELADNLWGSLEAIVPAGRCLGYVSTRETYAVLAKKLRPISLGCADASLIPPSFGGKKYDVFYAATNHFDVIPSRWDAATVASNLHRDGFNIYQPKQPIDRESFARAIAESWICLSPGGVGWDCYRHYEVAGQGSCPVMRMPSITQNAPFVHGESCYYFEGAADLEALLKKILQDKTQLARVTDGAFRHVSTHHTYSGIAEYVRSELTKVTE